MPSALSSMKTPLVVVVVVVWAVLPAVLAAPRSLRSLADLPTSTLDEDDIEEVVDTHNYLRRLPKAGNMKHMTWSQELADAAQLHVDKCVFQHGTFSWPGKTFPAIGQNMMFAQLLELPVDYAIVGFYNEVDHYNYETNTCAPGKVCGHYTQVVWAEADKVGCAKKRCSNMYFPDMKKNVTNAYFMTCNYSPPSNSFLGRPYKPGPPCSRCTSGHLWCDEGLCRDCSSDGSSNCECKADCQNCGTKGPDCTCSCAAGFMGATCRDRCADLSDNCGSVWQKFACNLREAQKVVPHFCPKMCGVCESIEGPCKNTTTPSTTISTTTTPSTTSSTTTTTIKPGCGAVEDCGTKGQWDDDQCKCTCQSGHHGRLCQHTCPRCFDAYTDVCPTWRNKCEDTAYVDFMKFTCALTCGFCTIPEGCR